LCPSAIALIKTMPMKTSNQDNALLGAIIGALPDPVFVVDEHGRYVEVLGGRPDASGGGRDLVGRSLSEVLPPDVAEEMMATIHSALDGGGTRVEQFRLGDGDERARWYEVRIAPLPAEPGEPRRVAWLSADITERKLLEHQLEEAALIDPLTQVGNERHFMRVLDQEIRRQGRYKEPFCLLLLRVDQLETVQAAYGQEAADGCLREIARIIRQELRHSDVPARTDEAEFGVLLLNTSMKWGLEVGERIRIRIARMPFALPQRLLHLTVSGGITDFRTNDSPGAMLARAEKALFKSEDAGQDRISVG